MCVSSNFPVVAKSVWNSSELNLCQNRTLGNNIIKYIQGIKYM